MNADRRFAVIPIGNVETRCNFVPVFITSFFSFSLMMVGILASAEISLLTKRLVWVSQKEHLFADIQAWAKRDCTTGSASLC